MEFSEKFVKKTRKCSKCHITLNKVSKKNSRVCQKCAHSHINNSDLCRLCGGLKFRLAGCYRWELLEDNGTFSQVAWLRSLGENTTWKDGVPKAVRCSQPLWAIRRAFSAKVAHMALRRIFGKDLARYIISFLLEEEINITSEKKEKLKFFAEMLNRLEIGFQRKN